MGIEQDGQEGEANGFQWMEREGEEGHNCLQQLLTNSKSAYYAADDLSI